MGNYTSCVLVGKQSKAAKVMFPSGEMKILEEATKAAELMLEIPNFFLVNSKSLEMGHPFSALNADEDLEMGNIYVMFPMKRVSSFVTAADMASVFLAANHGKVKVVPAPDHSETLTVSVKEGLHDLFFSPEFHHRRSSFCRSKKPFLETIAEEPISVC